MGMEYVVDFVQMKRFDDPLLVEVLEETSTIEFEGDFEFEQGFQSVRAQHVVSL